MLLARHPIIGVILILVSCVTTGCNLVPHDLKPWRLWRLNRMPASSRNAYFSISDRIPIEQDELLDQQSVIQPESCAVLINESAP